jgi:anti-sigma B factor antagonist
VPQVSSVSASSAAGLYPAPPPFLCTLNTGGTRAAWVHVVGELDLVTSPQLERKLREAEIDARLVVVDMRDVRFMDSSGVHVLVAASDEAEWGGARLMVIPSAAVERVLRLSGVADRVSTFDMSSGELPPELHLAQAELPPDAAPI